VSYLTALSISNYVALMIDKLEKDLEGSGPGLVEVLYCPLPGGTKEPNSVKEEYTK
jgi:hypothetical protein